MGNQEEIRGAVTGRLLLVVTVSSSPSGCLSCTPHNVLVDRFVMSKTQGKPCAQSGLYATRDPLVNVDYFI